ncbi:MAG: hypothetical protein LBQ38_04745 [Spirochaetaceae bacterium]|jgi:hypothetical protein|nr:hypothetical protein [Spirochaetaceae bacterium]
MYVKQVVAILFLGFMAASGPLGAEDTESSGGIRSDRSLALTLSSLPEAKVGFTQGFTFPFLRGDNPLTAGNNIRTTFTAEISPISMDGIAEGTWTPIAFLQVIAGLRIGTGWNINLFGGEVKGIGINRPKADGTAETAGSAFDGLQWSSHLGGAFQFDMAAIFPGDWHHVVFRSYHEARYWGYSAASAGDSWHLENDAGENRNGFNYYGSYLIGYQMPIFLNTVGFLAEMDKYLYDTPNRDIWGDGLGRWTFSAVLNFTITDWLGAALITQFETRRNYTDTDWEDLFYQYRHLDTADPRRLAFYRVAAILSFKLP